MRLLALDCGFQTGFAVVEPGKPPITGSHAIPGSADRLGLACHHFGHLVRKLIEQHNPGAMVICTPFISTFAITTKTGLNRATPNISPTKILFGMFGMAKAVAYSASDLPVYDLHEPAVRRAFNIVIPRSIKGREKRRKALKAAVIERCRENGWYVTDDHAGDALLAAAYQMRVLRPADAYKTTPLFAQEPPRRRARKSPRKLAKTEA